MFDFLWTSFLGCVVIAASIDARQHHLVNRFDGRIDKKLLRQADNPMIDSMECNCIFVLFCQYFPVWNIIYSWKRLTRVKLKLKRYQRMLDDIDMSNRN
jgi:hypothetical protein